MSATKTMPGGGTPGGLQRSTDGKELHRQCTTEPCSGQVVTIFADGACEPYNPGGLATWGWCALDAHNRILAQDYGFLGSGQGMTNNVAEYSAALAALRWAADQGLRDVRLYMDSQLVVNQAMGIWNCNAAHLWPRLAGLRILMIRTGATLHWIPREQNTRADRLSRLAYEEARKAVAP